MTLAALKHGTASNPADKRKRVIRVFMVADKLARLPGEIHDKMQRLEFVAAF
jgi:hypothetical protein